MLGAAFVAGMFDAVLLLALPTLVIWTALGALWSAGASAPALKAAANAAALQRVILVLLVAAGTYRSASQLLAMQLEDSQPRRATAIDPGNYRIHLRLARGGNRKQRCEHARAAHALFPAAEAARALSRGCGSE